MSHQPTIPIANEPARYCRRCGYELRGLTTPRCPECGRGFDPINPKTYRHRPIRHWLQPIKRAAIVLVTIFLLLAAAWGWFYWGWYVEQKALAGLKVRPRYMTYTHLGSPWFRRHIGSAGFVLDRVDDLMFDYRGEDSNITDFSPLANLKHLKSLWLDETKVRDLSPLAGLRELQLLHLLQTRVSDISPLTRLTNLEQLDLCLSSVSDISPLSGLTGLQLLDLSYTSVGDISPLCGLTKLRELNIVGTKVRDVSSLFNLKSLHVLYLSRATITEAQVKELHRALPDCQIVRE